MGFGADLQGRISHEALLKIQDAELRLLENIKRCILIRVESDRQYASSLSKFVQQAVKVDVSEHMDCLSFFRAWDMLVKETDNIIRRVRENADHLSMKTFDMLTTVINEKKAAKKFYMDERNRIESDFTKLQDEVQRNKQDYGRTVDKLKVDKAKLVDLQAKGKGGSKLDDARSKLHRTVVKLHKLHNDYVFSVKDVTEFQAGYLEHTLPSFLDYHQSVQELLISQSKFVLEDYHRMTNFSSSEYQSIFQKIEDSIAKVSPEQEFTHSFISKYKSDPIPRLTFEFDERLLDDYHGNLKPNTLELDELTMESLQHRKSACKDQLTAAEQSRDEKNSLSQEWARDAQSLESHLHDNQDSEVLNDYTDKKRRHELCRKELSELEGNIKRLKILCDFVSLPLDELGENSPPVASNFQENGDVDTASNVSTSSTSKKKQGFSLAILRRKSEGILKSSRDGISKSKENLDHTAVRQQDSYEQHEPSESNTNGPRTSLAAMREAGLMEDCGLPEPKARLEEEEWFHGVLPREEVQRLLNNDGDYIVRESKNKRTNETQYVLSVYWQGYKHFIIQGAEGGWRFEGPSLPTISELVHQQHCSGQPVTTKSQAILKTPILREEWELMNDDIFLEMKIGNGNFGEVYKGLYKPKEMVVAVKTCKDTLSEDQRKKFLQEGRILKQYNHPNIVQFIGIAAQRQPVMIVMEFVSGGALLNFLRKQGRSQTKVQLTQMCVDAASGMAYLEGKGCIHRDLAARNCLVGEKNVVKISDFGMSREEEEYTVSEGMKQIPIKWTAPEALNFGKYTAMCDVWSFGILMWEIFSFGTTPYQGWTNGLSREKIEDGYRMPSPSGCPEEAYAIMKKCWEYHPENRPHFEDVYKELSKAVKRL